MSSLSRGVLLAALVVSLAGIAFAQTATLTNDSSRDYPDDAFWVGDPFTLTVNGSANKTVTMHAIFNAGEATYNWDLDPTDGGGVSVTQAAMGEWAIGHWEEVVYVDGVEVASGHLVFDIQEPDDADPCTIIPEGTSLFETLISIDNFTFNSGSLPIMATYTTTEKYFQPQSITHRITAGPCRVRDVYQDTDLVAAEYESEEVDGFERVVWTIEDGEEGVGSFGRNMPDPIWTEQDLISQMYVHFEDGFVRTVFENEDNPNITYVTTTYYFFQIVACAHDTNQWNPNPNYCAV